MKKIILLYLFFVFSIYSESQSNAFLPLENKQWQLENDNVTSNINIQKVWQITKDGKTFENNDIVIAIIDREVQIDHPDLKSNIWINRNEIPNNNIDDDSNGYVDDTVGWNFRTNNNDISNSGIGHPHGTAVNGIIGANGFNKEGVTGLNRRVKLLNLVRGNSVSSIFSAYEYLIKMRRDFNQSEGLNGDFIVAINLSWGIDSLSSIDSTHFIDLISIAGKEGILTCCASPNEHINTDEKTDYPTSFNSDYIISVTNIDKNNDLIDLSGYGKHSIDIGAPGHNSYTTYNLNRYGYFSGTSASVCYITGAVGLLYTLPSTEFINNIYQNPGHIALRIKDALLSGVTQISSLKNKTVSNGKLNIYDTYAHLIELYNLDLDETLYSISKNIHFYPNPFTGNVKIVINNCENDVVNIVIHDLYGNIVYTNNLNLLFDNFNTNILNLESLNIGSYVIKITINKKIEFYKIIKI